ncbi:MAG: AMP-binding protein [Verrucomicrobia bacterium]|nr:AMP-binding protein [Verrucomicrobiota bacterium]
MDDITRQLEAALTLALPASRPAEFSCLLDGRSAEAFWAGFLDAQRQGRCACAVDPDWPQAWKDAVWAEAASADIVNEKAFRLLLPTGGSTGRPRLCLHDLGTLSVAAQGYAQRFANENLYHSVSCLPPYHVGGMMPALRAVACGGRIAYLDYRDPDSFPQVTFPLRESALSLVPTQLRRILATAGGARRLRSFGLILVGGAACPADLLRKARAEEIPLAPCYGSTETAAMITVLSPAAFLAGKASSGTALPHVRLAIESGSGRLLVDAESNLRAYVPARRNFSRHPFRTQDLAKLDPDGGLRILGRHDRVIISGGKKIQPEAVEEAALRSGLCADVLCRAREDADWGQAVVLVVVPRDPPSFGKEVLLRALRDHLPSAALPKSIDVVAEIPRSAAGKPQLPDCLSRSPREDDFSS